MKIVFVSNFINHHQIPLSDAFNAQSGIEYKFIETTPMPDSFIAAGYPKYEREYLIRSHESSETECKARDIIDSADVVIIGSAPEEWVQKRLWENKVTFHYSERWFKTGYRSLLSPRAWYFWIKFHIRYRNKRSYMLCASAFTASDVHKVFAYPNKCFKWGYFTKVDDIDIDAIERKRDNSTIKLLYVARLIDWKHPEMPVILGKELKRLNIKFEINMYGSGPEHDRIKRLIKHNDLENLVHLRGNITNESILQEMRNHHIFLFTSDRNEGWGAVVNEAMSNGCVVVGSNKIGSIPYLISRVFSLMLQKHHSKTP